MNGSESLRNDESAATENALRRAVDTTPAFIHTARPDGYLDYFNRGWLDFLGKSLEDVCGWRWTDSVHPEDVAELVQKWHAALASGEPLEVEARVRRADGSYRAFLHRKLPLRDEHGNIVKWFGSSVDIEDRKCAEQKIAEETNKLKRSEFYLRDGERLRSGDPLLRNRPNSRCAGSDDYAGYILARHIKPKKIVFHSRLLPHETCRMNRVQHLKTKKGFLVFSDSGFMTYQPQT
jgi:PAS domain S-box-containing protein